MSGVSRARRDGLQRDFISDAGELSEGGIWGEVERTTNCCSYAANSEYLGSLEAVAWDARAEASEAPCWRNFC